MKKIAYLFILLFVFSCGKDHDLTVKGTVKGLKKGTIYLQKVSDTLLVAVDSVSIKGDSNFELHSSIETPEMFYLFLDKNSNTEERLSFFADKGITEINTTLKNFIYDAKITGSKQQEVLNEYNKMKRDFNNKFLDLTKQRIEAQIANNTEKADSIQKVYDNYLKSKYRYSYNFSLKNLDSEVTPYIAITEMVNANVKVLDSIYNSLNKEVASSKYGMQLEDFIKKIKETETE